MSSSLSPDLLRKMDASWRAANYLSVGQIYLLDNPLLKEPLPLKHVKPRLLGHWGTTPGLNFLSVHLDTARLALGRRRREDSQGRHGGGILSTCRLRLSKRCQAASDEEDIP